MLFTYVVFFLLSSIFSNNILAMDDEQHEEEVNPPLKRLCVAPALPFTSFVEKINIATEKYDFGAIINAYYEFKDLRPEPDWQREMEAYPAIQWHSQSLKNAVGSQLFFDSAINQPHQNLLRNALRPFLGYTQGSQSLEESLIQIQNNLSKIISNHPYFRNRFTLYGLSSAYHLGHPVAHLILEEGLRHLYNEERDADQEDNADRFFTQSHNLLKLKLQNNSQQLQEFISLDGIDAFTDLEEDSLNDLRKLEQKAALGLIHYDVLQETRKNPKLSVYFYDERTLKRVIDHFIMLGKQGDFEGYYDAALLIAGAVDNKKIYKTEEDIGEGYYLYETYIEFSYIYGYHKARERVSMEEVDRLRKEKGIYPSIFKELKRFIIPKRKKK